MPSKNKNKNDLTYCRLYLRCLNIFSKYLLVIVILYILYDIINIITSN